MIIQSHLLRAALVCVAKNDPRYYLQGIHINNKYIEATNGHVALRMEHDIKTRRDSIIEFHGSVPKKAKTTEFHFTKEPYAVHRDAHGKRIGFTALVSYDDCRFPDLDRVIPKNNEECQPYFQVQYLTYPQKMFGNEAKFVAVTQSPSGMTSGCLFKFNDSINRLFGNPQFVVMPCRV